MGKKKSKTNFIQFKNNISEENMDLKKWADINKNNRRNKNILEKQDEVVVANPEFFDLF